MSLSVVLKADGTIDKRVIGSVTEYLVVDDEYKKDRKRANEIFENPSLQMVSFTITEKGYLVTREKGEMLSSVKEGFQSGPDGFQGHLMGRIAAFCYRRYLVGQYPLALVSMDNCSHNGDILKESVLAFVREWCGRGLAESGFLDYMQNPDSISFPWSMIDKITPRPDEKVVEMLKQDGFEDTDIIITDKNTYTAPFVNSEETGYLVIEDSFPNGRPPLEKAGLYFTDRETVDKAERMKVCTCLNPLHTALAVFGCLLGYKRIYEEMRDKDLSSFVRKMCYEEGMPVVVDPGIINPREFAQAVLTDRLPNPFMPDTPQRIATDTSQKIPIRFGETIKSYQNHPNLNVRELNRIPLVLAGWCRYLMGVDDQGNVLEQSPDPMLKSLTAHFDGIHLGENWDAHEVLKDILSNKQIFAVNLYEAGLGEKIEGMFWEMTRGVGAVRETLSR
jgi:fructuronate reductase